MKVVGTFVSLTHQGTDHMISINGLTTRQVDMLDHMWSIDSCDDFMEWQGSLDSDERRMSELLMNLVMLEELDATIDAASSYIEAKAVINKLMQK